MMLGTSHVLPADMLSEWFGIYQIGQRVASRFTDRSQRVYIAGDVRCHSSCSNRVDMLTQTGESHSFSKSGPRHEHINA